MTADTPLADKIALVGERAGKTESITITNDKARLTKEEIERMVATVSVSG